MENISMVIQENVNTIQKKNVIKPAGGPAGFITGASIIATGS